METIKEKRRESPQQIGDFITRQQYEDLTDGFKKKFPENLPFVLIQKIALTSILANKSISGIRFMYGMGDADKEDSRMLVLMPGNYTMNGSLPNAQFENSFYTNSGELISAEESFSLLFNHVLNFRKKDSTVPYTKIIRGCYFGKDLLLELLAEVKGNEAIYHFGYDEITDTPFKPILQPDMHSDIFLDNGELSPPSDPVRCVATYVAKFAKETGESNLNILRTFRDELLQNSSNSSVEIERYYTISPSVIECLKSDRQELKVMQILFNRFYKPSLEAIKVNDRDKALELFKESLVYLTDKYLYQ